MSAVLDGLSPDFACVTLADPKMTITLNADAIADAFEYVAKRESAAAPAPAPAPAPAAASVKARMADSRAPAGRARGSVP
jgi:hypothetical protein